MAKLISARMHAGLERHFKEVTSKKKYKQDDIAAGRAFASTTSARLLIIDALIGPANEQSPGHLYDITFLVLLGGRVRTEEEYSALLRQTGFGLQRVLSTESDVSILEAFAI